MYEGFKLESSYLRDLNLFHLDQTYVGTLTCPFVTIFHRNFDTQGHQHTFFVIPSPPPPSISTMGRQAMLTLIFFLIPVCVSIYIYIYYIICLDRDIISMKIFACHPTVTGSQLATVTFLSCKLLLVRGGKSLLSHLKVEVKILYSLIIMRSIMKFNFL